MTMVRLRIPLAAPQAAGAAPPTQGPVARPSPGFAPTAVEAGAPLPPPPPTATTQQVGPEVTVAAASDTEVRPDWWAVGVVLAAVAVAAVLAWLGNLTWDTGAASAVAVPAQGLSVFAFFYVIAQAEERALEPLSWVLLRTSKLEAQRDTKLATAQTSMTLAGMGQTTVGTATTLVKDAADAQADLDKRRANRTLIFWAIATVVALFASAYLKLYFLRVIGLLGAPRFMDILITGLVVGAGTKPLHDLITQIETSKNKAQDSAQGA
jgi:hypothetical protein